MIPSFAPGEDRGFEAGARRMTFAATEGRRADLVAGVLLLVQLLVLLHTARCEGETYDEPMYLLAGRTYWDDADFSFNREHPPLVKLLIGLPLKVDGLAVPPAYQVQPGSPVRFLHEWNDRPLRTVFLGRLGPILLGLVLAWFVYRLGKLWAGPKVGLAALVAVLALPVVTGNAALAALDVGSAALILVAIDQFARLRLAPSAWRTLLAGGALGLAQLTKFTALALVPVFALLLSIDAVRGRTARPLLRGVGMGLVALTTMFAGYAGELRTMSSIADHPRFVRPNTETVFADPTVARVASAFGDRPIPMASYLRGLDRVKSGEGAAMFPGYFMGERRTGEGWPSFYLVGLAVKTPVGILLLLAMASLLLPWLGGRPKVVDAAALLAAITFVTFSLASKQVGMRYVLPALPLVALLVGRLVTFDAGKRPIPVVAAAIVGLIGLPAGLFLLFSDFAPAGPLRLTATIGAALVGVVLVRIASSGDAAATTRGFRRIVVGLLLVGLGEAAARHPEHLMFYNAFAGGPDHGYEITSIGDDWGQGTAALARRQREAGWGTIRYAYYGTSKPEAHGLDFEHWGGRPVRGKVAIHTVVWTRHRPTYAFLEGLEPTERVDSILVFDVPEGHRPPPAAPPR